jgi:proline iminopeptidase
MTRFLVVVLLSLVLASVAAAEMEESSVEQGYKRVNGVDHFYRMVGEGEPYVVLHGGPGMYHDELYPFSSTLRAAIV